MQKENVEVVIMGKVYTISGQENKEYLQRVASYLDRKIREISEAQDFNRLSHDYRQLLIHLNLVDDYFKAQDWAERLEQDKEKSQKEIYNLKQRIVDLEMSLSDQLERIQKLEGKNNEKK